MSGQSQCLPVFLAGNGVRADRIPCSVRLVMQNAPSQSCGAQIAEVTSEFNFMLPNLERDNTAVRFRCFSQVPDSRKLHPVRSAGSKMASAASAVPLRDRQALRVRCQTPQIEFASSAHWGDGDSAGNGGW